MIVYTLSCAHNHSFEEWFTSSGRYDEMAAAGEIVCPECGSHQVEKAPMAPSLGSSGNSSGGCEMAEAFGGAPPCMAACGGGCSGR